MMLENYKTTDSLQIHALHSAVHSTNHRSHVASYLSHCHSRLNTTGNSIDTASQTKEVERFALLPYCVRSVYSGTIVVALL
jgi:hypothetical protein